MLFRPEQEHGFSGENDVLVPVAGGDGKVDDSLMFQQVSGLHL
jgi:hypothetical protein